MNDNLSSKLKSLKASRGVGRVVVSLIWLLVVSGFVALLFGLVDSAFVLPQKARGNAFYFCIFIVACTALYLIWKFVRISDHEAAVFLDAKIDSTKSDVADALSLQSQKNESELHGFLKQKAIDEACGKINTVKAGAKWPLKGIGIGFAGLLIFAGVLLVVRSFAPQRFDTHAQRIIKPNEDIPPFTNLKFELLSDDLEAVYGGDLEVKVKITGEDILEDVVCVVRNSNNGATSELTALKESRSVFVQRFSDLLSDSEFAFQVGNARSKWYEIGVLLQPEIAKTQVEVIPPSYTKNEKQVFDLEGGELPLISGSRVYLRINSNRPLAAGKMKVIDLESGKVIDQLETNKLVDDKTIEFEWVVKGSSKLEFEVFDVRQTASKSKLVFEQKAIQDMAPELALNQPAPRVLATPEMKLNFKGEVDDDFGLSEVSIYRTLIGFRDRGELVENNIDREEYEYSEAVNLGDMGVKPGQMLEFYLEAKDYNPNMLGVAASDPVVVEIISNENYAQILRDRAILKEFTTRYSVLSKQIADAKKSLKELEEAMESGDQKAIDEARRQAEEAHKKSGEMMKKLASDFKAFDMEGRLKQIASEGAQKLKENRDQIAAKGDKLSKADIQEMLKRLGEPEKQAKQLAEDADKIRKAAKVMAMAAEYKQIYVNQESIRDRMAALAKEMAFGQNDNIAQLKSLGKLQAKNKERLEKFAEDLRKHADDLPEEMLEMKESVDSFLSKLEKLNIPSPMKSSASAAEEGRSRDSTEDAHLSFTLLKQLMDEP